MLAHEFSIMARRRDRLSLMGSPDERILDICRKLTGEREPVRLRDLIAREAAALLDALDPHAPDALQTAQMIGELAGHVGELQRERQGHTVAPALVGTSARIRDAVRTIEQIRDSTVNVLITGEPGTGKSLAAQTVHFTSPRARKPFVSLACAALPEQALEGQLFAHFERADGGTLFLDEIDGLSPAAQARILRLLEERAFEREGTKIAVDTRLVAASARDLEFEIGKGHFREDLYYHIRVIHIHLPPLREIREDIPLLAGHFLREHCREAGRETLRFSPAVLQDLAAAPWHGNSAQLRAEIARMAGSAMNGVIEALSPRKEAAPARPRSLKIAVEELEREMIVAALASANHNQQQAARLLGLSRQGLINKIKRYGIGGPGQPA
jgi:DNA-binding NtrC family response regulator